GRSGPRRQGGSGFRNCGGHYYTCSENMNMNNFKIYNTLTSQKELFEPLSPEKVGMYVCGITPYGESHLGHGRCYVVFDVLRRFLRFMGYEVRYIQNITDIDDKIINRALKEKKPPREIADRYIESFFKSMEMLNVAKADEYPRVSNSINEIIEFTAALIEKSFAYESGGSVYFRAGMLSEYGCLSGRSISDMQAGEFNSEKESQEDFALWKKDEQFGWESPWGKGRPGWHIECSVMSEKQLGEVFDIHGGGLDLIFPHHENEIAQSCALTGKIPARYWLHNGMVKLKGAKMAKSTGNFFLLPQLLDKFNPMVVRMYMLRTGYRQDLDFDPALLEEQSRAYSRLVAFKKELYEKAGKRKRNEKPEFSHPAIAALLDDLNTPRAMGEVFKIATPALSSFYNGNFKDEDIYEGFKILEIIENILGIKLIIEDSSSENDIDKLVMEREKFRKQKNYEQADRIREQLDEMGIEVKDTPTGPRWTKVK
ncbi:MAG: cysteine--tRNA ligase, partial [Elusimicrobiota bacterium]